MNAKQAKKLRWMARVNEAMMDDPVMVRHKVLGIDVPDSIFLYAYHKIGYAMQQKADGTLEKVEVPYYNTTVQYNPAKSGKGSYRAMKAKFKEIGIARTALPTQSISYVRLMCQLRIRRGLDQRRAVKMAAERASAVGGLAPERAPADARLVDQPPGNAV